MRAAAVLVAVLWIWGGCGGDDDGPIDARSGPGADDAAGPGEDAAAPDGDGGGACTESADCGGDVCCDPGLGNGGGCVPTFDDCAGLVLCGDPDDCPAVNPTCCPQGFCGGCD